MELVSITINGPDSVAVIVTKNANNFTFILDKDILALPDWFECDVDDVAVNEYTPDAAFRAWFENGFRVRTNGGATNVDITLSNVQGIMLVADIRCAILRFRLAKAENQLTAANDKINRANLALNEAGF